MTDKNFSRTTSRLAAVQILYQLDLKDEFVIQEKALESVIKTAQEHAENLNIKFLKRIIVLALQNMKEIDSIIATNLKDDNSEAKLATLLKATLRAGICEALYFNTPSKVTIDEYVKIAKGFFGKEEVGFVNAMLDKVRKT